MGCTPSKLDSDDTVRRCKDRRRLMKEAVFSRHHLAAAHSDYCRALISTGSALVSFASGEPLSVSDHSPAAAAAATAHSPSPPPPMSTAASSRHHRPPRRRKQPIKLPHILSDSSFTASPPPNHDFFTNNVRSNSTYATTPSQASSIWNWENLYPPPSPPDSEFFDHLNPTGIPANNNNDDEDSSSSSSDDHIDNDNRAPAFSPNSHRNPHSKQFDDLESNSSPHSRRSGINQSRQFDDLESNYSKHSSRSEINQTRKFDDLESNYSSNSRRSGINQPRKFDDLESNYSTHSRRSGINQPRKFDDLESNYSTHSRRSEIKQTWKFDDLESNYSTYSGINQRRNFSKKIGGEETEREEIECSEWGDHDHDHYSSSSSDEGDLQSRSDYGVRNEKNSKYSSKLEKISSDDDDAKQGANSETRIVVRHRNLVEIVAALMENFNKAAAAGEQVTEMLEAGRDQLDRSFKLLRKRVYHSSGMLSTLSSSWTSKPPLRVKYRFEPTSVEQPGGPKSLCSTLERLLAWEKKLYQEVKAREGVKIEHEKKLSVLQGQEYRGEEEAKLDKTKASIKRLQSLMVVTSQAVSSTSSAIVGLRDSDLIPQLVELCHGFMYMWRSMNRSHALQNDVVQQVKGLVHRASKGEPTSDPHRQATADLESAVSAWHSTFGRVIKFQRHLARALHGWFKLTLLPVHNGPATRGELPEVLAFFDEWKLSLERVPDTVASEAIISFNNVVHSIHAKQTEEAKVKKRAGAASRELERKASAIRNLERKYYNSYSMVGLGPPDTGPGNGQMLDARDPLAEKKAELAAYRRRVEDEMIKHAKAVEVTRAMTLNNIQTGLPGVFQAMTSFSAMMAEALDSVCTRSYAI